MVVHLECGIATAACEAHNVVLAVIYYDSRLINGDVVCPHIEDNTNFSLILQVGNKEQVFFCVIFMHKEQFVYEATSGLSRQQACLSSKSRSFVTWAVCLVLSLGYSNIPPQQPAQVS